MEKSQVRVDTVLTYCHCSLNDNTLLNYVDEFKVLSTFVYEGFKENRGGARNL